MADEPPPSSAGRKRSLPQSETEASPSTTSGHATKKRRYGGLATAPSPSTPRGFRAITSAIGNVLFGREQTKHSAAKAQIDADSLYDDIPSSGDDISQTKADLPIKYNKFSREVVKETLRDTRTSPKKPAANVRKSVPNIQKPKAASDDSASKEAQQLTPTRRTTIQKSIARNGSREKLPVSRSKKSAEESGHDESSHTINAAPPRPPQLKGILSPSKKRVGTPRKSVAFDSNAQDTQEEIFFADPPVKAKATPKHTASTRKPRIPAPTERSEPDHPPPESIVEGTGTESEDDEVCVLCSKPDSEPPNEILFCENCDLGYHQVCHDVPVIPEGDWICRNCSQEDAVAKDGRQGQVLDKDTVKASSIIPTIPNFEAHLRSMQRILIDRCSGARRIKLCDQEEAYDKAYQLMEQTILAGEGNSMMVIGARGCGKTTLVETIISDLAAEHATEFHVVRLNGFIHTDDKLALKDIWRQLGKEMSLDDDEVNKTSNYADTMASLLALLSHPAEITDAEEGLTSRSVVFIIDEFDLFATHARQTLLYNLFDIAQAKKAPIAVLGLTTRIDVVETLEKRVKSRFSHRYVYMSQPKTLAAFWKVCRQGLVVDHEDLEKEGFDTAVEGALAFQKWWTEKIEAFAKTPGFEDHLEYQYYATKSVQIFLTSWILPLSELSPTDLNIALPSSSTTVSSLDLVESKLQLLAGLSDLELAMLISAARLDIVAHTDTVNFAMAYDEYTSQMGKQRVQSAGSAAMLALGAGAKAWGRGVSAVAWERLVLLGLLIPAGIGTRSNAAHAGLEGKMWKLDVSLEEIPTAVDLPAYLGKWCTQI
ncbi:origin recognition complex subunit 4 C-terminus-domain-containing protein [Microdochium trichocladiopsis]|uniref:Origin recognition complex subunit 4 n=1 Tax=Microdochium trichocladiopsis TaxID=1682393 RepID=A0A9P8Y7I5_9PEZI|nr:origin recognition complex subunit 4 C-terminus-domain-containing protein [Microdochium trichocladiopsis]KAH7031148.1 origin recognition complex subunit 4 C-terminus-domain-containing protein [Microdochium trichocladiopsis]